jgi:hypothetical protein
MGIGSLVGTSLKFGQPIATRPANLSFACKYTPTAGDSAFVLVYLTHWNGASRDTVARGKYAQGTTTTSWAVQSITLAYNPSFASVVPDTELVFASSSIYSHYGPKMGSTFYVDDFAFSGYNSTNDLPGMASSVSYYPNPASNSMNFKSSVDASSIEVIDVTGKLVGRYTVDGKEFKLETINFAPGLYIYNLYDKNKAVINRGKFEIAK